MTASRRVVSVAVVAASLLLLFVSVSIVAAGSATAHSFLVSATPGQGERLSGSPDSIVLAFSEAVDPTTVELRVRDARDRPVDAAAPELVPGRLSIRSSLPSLDDGIYVVSWQAFSDLDGHGSFGEHSFAVGDTGGSLPAATSSSSGVWWGTAASWLFFAGFALAAGSLVVQLLEVGPVASERAVVRAGLSIALAGSIVSWLDRALAETTSGLALAAASAASVALATSVHGVARRPVVPLGLLVASAAFWSARSHAASVAGLVGGAVDAVHLGAAGIWVGALVAIALRVRRSDRPKERTMVLLRRYSRLALPLVVILAGTGVVSAFQLLPTWSDLWSTGYGRLLVAKATLFGVALVLAAVGRWRGIRTRRLPTLRRSTAAEAAVVVVALVMAGFLANVAPPVPASAAEALLGPPPLDDPVARDAGLAGQLNVEVASDGHRIEVMVFSPSGPLSDTRASVAVTMPSGAEADLRPRPCGPGCFTQALDLATGVTQAQITASAPGWTGGTYHAALAWPPRPRATDRLDAVLAAMRAVPKLTVLETVDSGPGSVVDEQRIELSGADFVAVEPYAGGNVTDVRALPGQPDRLMLYLPGSRIFAVLVLDDADRMSSSRLISPGHDIRRRFSYPESAAIPTS